MTTHYESIAKYSFIAMLAAALLGCAQPLRRVETESLGVRHVYDKNYTLNKTQSVSVGEAIVQVKDYYVERKNIPMLTPTQSFSAGVCGHPSMNYVAGTKYNIVGAMNHNGDPYYVVQATDWSVLVDKNGYIKFAARDIGNGKYDVGLCSVDVSPVSARFEQLAEERASVEKGYENYELLYNGIDKNSMTFTYREFSPEGLARVAFYQNLTYDSKAKTIKFRKFKIDIVEANSEGISYTVVGDSK